MTSETVMMLRFSSSISHHLIFYVFLCSLLITLRSCWVPLVLIVQHYLPHPTLHQPLARHQQLQTMSEKYLEQLLYHLILTIRKLLTHSVNIMFSWKWSYGKLLVSQYTKTTIHSFYLLKNQLNSVKNW